MDPVDVTWQPDAESLTEGYRVYSATPAAKRSQRFRLAVVGAFFLVILVFAFLSDSTIGVFIVVLFAVFVVRRMFTGGASDRRWAEAFMRDPNSRHPQRLEVSDRSVTFHLGGIVSTWVWPEIVAVHESPLAFTFITPGSSEGTGATRVNAIVNSVVILPRKNLTADDDQRLRAIVSEQNKLMKDGAAPA
jgi:hypothetical protein